MYEQVNLETSHMKMCEATFFGLMSSSFVLGMRTRTYAVDASRFRMNPTMRTLLGSPSANKCSFRGIVSPADEDSRYNVSVFFEIWCAKRTYQQTGRKHEANILGQVSSTEEAPNLSFRCRKHKVPLCTEFRGSYISSTLSGWMSKGQQGPSSWHCIMSQRWNRSSPRLGSMFQGNPTSSTARWHNAFRPP